MAYLNILGVNRTDSGRRWWTRAKIGNCANIVY